MRQCFGDGGNVGNDAIINLVALCVIAFLGFTVLVGVFYRMRGGFGPYNLRIVGIVLVATLSAMLATLDKGTVTAAVGVLGAIAGYLFGIRTKTDQGDPPNDEVQQDPGKKNKG